jgi:hypothetical protein
MPRAQWDGSLQEEGTMALEQRRETGPYSFASRSEGTAQPEADRGRPRRLLDNSRRARPGGSTPEREDRGARPLEGEAGFSITRIDLENRGEGAGDRRRSSGVADGAKGCVSEALAGTEIGLKASWWGEPAYFTYTVFAFTNSRMPSSPSSRP